MTIRPDYFTLGDLLQGRLFRVPNYQRAYSWETKQRQDLFGDIEKLVDKNVDRHHFMATVVCLQRQKKEEIGIDEFGVYDIVDGQQRLTTLIILLKALAKVIAEPSDEDPQREEKQKQASKLNELLVKGDKRLVLLQTNHDSAMIFRSYLGDGTVPDEQKADTLAERNLVRAFKECEEFVCKWDRDETKGALLLLQKLRNRLDFVFYVIEDEGAVYTVFEVLNSRGLEVDWLDKCKSLLMGIAFEQLEPQVSDERIQELHKYWGKIYRTIGVREIPGDEILKFAATLMYSEPQSRILSAERAMEFFGGYCKQKPEEVIGVSAWLTDVAGKLKDLYKNPRLKAVTEISQARLLAIAIMLNEHLSDRCRERLLQEWEKITFRIYGMFRKDARTKVGEYTRLSHRIYQAKDMPVDQIAQEIVDLGKDHPIDGAIEELRSHDCYNGWEDELRYFFYRYEEYLAAQTGVTLNKDRWSEIWSGSPSTTIEHIHPQTPNLSQTWIGKIPGSREEIEKQVHCLGNLMLLPPNVNSQAGKKSFREKKSIYQKHYLRLMDEVLAKKDWDREAIQERETGLLTWAKGTWG